MNNNNSVVVSGNMSNVLELCSYEELDLVQKKLVDETLDTLRVASDMDLIKYGKDISANMVGFSGSMIMDKSSYDGDSINDKLKEIMDQSKSIVPRRSVFRKVSAPTTDEKREFVGMIGELASTIEMQMGRLMESNVKYKFLVSQLRENIDAYAINMIAIDRYLNELPAGNDDPDAQARVSILKSKRNGFHTSRVADLQTAISFMGIYNININVVRQLNEILEVSLPILQNQVLVRVAILETTKTLDDCDEVGKAISDITASNIRELRSAMERIGKQSENDTNLEDMNKLLVDLAKKVKETNAEARKKNDVVGRSIRENEKNLEEIFNELMK